MIRKRQEETNDRIMSPSTYKFR